MSLRDITNFLSYFFTNLKSIGFEPMIYDLWIKSPCTLCGNPKSECKKRSLNNFNS